jgi:hypothetical protein
MILPMVASFIGAIAGALAFACVGLVLSQYWPVFGGFLEKNLAQPLSSARMSLIPIHLLAFGLIGLALGGAGGFLLGFLIREMSATRGLGGRR